MIIEDQYPLFYQWVLSKNPLQLSIQHDGLNLIFGRKGGPHKFYPNEFIELSEQRLQKGDSVVEVDLIEVLLDQLSHDEREGFLDKYCGVCGTKTVDCPCYCHRDD